MYQQFLSDHISKTVAMSAPAFASQVAAHARLISASSSLVQRMAFNVSVAPAALDFVSYGVGVSDPDQRGQMVLSYAAALSVYGTGTHQLPYLAICDVQSAAPLAANTIINFTPTVDRRFLFGQDLAVGYPGNTLTFQFRGRVLVDTRVDSVSGGTVREFVVAAGFRAGGVAVSCFGSVEARLHAADENFWQPAK